MDYFERVEKVIKHPRNQYFHLPAIVKLVELYKKETGDLQGHNKLLVHQTNLKSKLLSKGRKIIIK